MKTFFCFLLLCFSASAQFAVSPSVLQQTSYQAATAAPTGHPTPDLLWWKMDAGSGTNLADSSSWGTNGGYGRGLTWVTGPDSVSGHGIKTTGTATTSWIISSNNLPMNITSNCGVSLWVQVTNPIAGGRMVFELTDNYNNTADSFNWSQFNATKFEAAIFGDNLNYYAETHPISPNNTWVHYVVNFTNGTAASGLGVWSNTVPVVLTVQNTNPITAHAFVAAPMYLNTRGQATLGNAGELADFCIMSRPWELTEITNLFNNPK